jgi:hypothetical protein
MFGQSKPVVLERYGRRRSRWLPPRWLVLLLIGTAAGAAGVLFVQERYLPPRLSASAGSELQKAFTQADADRTRLRGELAETSKRLDAALADRKNADEALVTNRAVTDRLRGDLASAVDALPPDPRGGTVEVRAAQFSAKGGLLAYDVVLTRSRDTAKPLTAVMQFSVAGESARGGETTAALKPVELSIGSHQVLRGSLALPEGFRPRQTTIQVLDRVGGRALGMRVMQVQAR